MLCPNCKQEIKRGAVHCENCGQPVINNPFHKTIESNSPKEILLIYTGRLIFTLLAIWMVKIALNGLSFIKELVFPSVNINALVIVNLLIMLIVFFLILVYSIQIRPFWAASYPRYQQAGLLFQTFLNLTCLQKHFFSSKNTHNCEKLMPSNHGK